MLVDMHQDLWSERFGGNGAPDWATLDDGQPFVAHAASPTPTCSRPSGGRSRASGEPRRDPQRVRARLRRRWRKLLAHEDAVIGYDAMNEPVVRADGGAVRHPAAARGGDAATSCRSIASSCPPCARRPDTPDLLRGLADDRLRLPVRGPPAATATRASATTSTAASRSARTRAPCRRPRRCATARATPRATTPPRCVTEFGATDKLDVLRRVVDRRRPRRRRLAVLAVQDLRRPDDRRPPAEGPDAESIVTPGGRRQGGQGARAGARRTRCASPGAARSGATARRDGRFTLRWTAARGADTVVALPRLAYPRGFDVPRPRRAAWCAARR